MEACQGKPSNNQPKGKGFHKHELLECHREAVERVITIPSRVKGSVDELFASPKVLNEQETNGELLTTIVSNIRYLRVKARQGIPLCVKVFPCASRYSLVRH